MTEETIKITDDLDTAMRLRIKKLIVNNPECGYTKIRHFIRDAIEAKLKTYEA